MSYGTLKCVIIYNKERNLGFNDYQIQKMLEYLKSNNNINLIDKSDVSDLIEIIKSEKRFELKERIVGFF